MKPDEKLLQVYNLSVGVQQGDRYFPAVDDIEFSMREGEILGLVGESGCGKSMTALAIAGLLSDNLRVDSGSIVFEQQDILHITEKEKVRLRGKDISMVFQEPMSSLNPLMKIGKQVAEVLLLHNKRTAKEAATDVRNVLIKVGLPDPDKVMRSYPHQLSGGMQQRVMIAMAIIARPKLLIADEPTTALDVTMQAQILDLLTSINREYKIAILFISHDLGVVSRFCHRMAVMYAGKIVEEGTVYNIFNNPVHEYTKGLIGSIPTASSRGKPLVSIKGHVPSVFEEHLPCPFAPRCLSAESRCFTEVPRRIHLNENHAINCVLAEKVSEVEYEI
ncbi:MAG: ABC transporter ATP-binding protein [Oscillospiraceae bacterium]|jgi:oligopeptide/dipeptide ABC transporter ATP-binding protein|nr:ABC transporter ATP-binding protein [Oscillospiraceae bacterium]